MKGPAIVPELAVELAQDPGWGYPWQLGTGVQVPLIHPGLAELHRSRLAMMEPELRSVLADAGEAATVLDLGCNEGWYGHRALDLGASYVLGIDLRAINIRRAQLLARHFGIDDDVLEFRQGDLFDLDLEEFGRFDVVLLLGLIYHVEDPVGLMRAARARTRRLCVVETQLTQQREPIEWGLGGSHNRESASFAAHLERGTTDRDTLASADGVLSLVPNRAAIEKMARAVGFADVEMCEPSDGHHEVYRGGDRGQFLCWERE